MGTRTPRAGYLLLLGSLAATVSLARALANLGLTAGPRAACYQPPSRLFKPDINLFNVISSLVLLQASVKQRGARRCKDQEERGADNHPGAVLPSPGEFWHPQSSSPTSKDRSTALNPNSILHPPSPPTLTSSAKQFHQ